MIKLQNIKNSTISRRIISLLKYYFILRVPIQKQRANRIIRRIKKKREAKVAFIVSSLGMWRCQGLLERLNRDDRFDINILISPFQSYAEESRIAEIQKLSKHFYDNKDKCIIVTDELNFIKWKKEFKPDILIYQQPYDGLYRNQIDWEHNRDCLIAYVPYFLALTAQWWSNNLPFHNLIWKHYLPSDFHRDCARKIAINGGENIVVVGDPRADDFINNNITENPWKSINDGHKRKKIIWAPHFQLATEGVTFSRPDFLWVSLCMVELAKNLKEKIQIAFKPHPKLKSKLYEHPDWGKEKTDNFYEFWASQPNTQIEEGEYINLFKTSDAIIHNCGSFTAEYLYTYKPAAYTIKDEDSLRHGMHTFGQRCVDGYYIIQNKTDLEKFINECVITEKDPLKEVRITIFNEILKTPGNNTFADNVYQDFVKSLF